MATDFFIITEDGNRLITEDGLNSLITETSIREQMYILFSIKKPEIGFTVIYPKITFKIDP